MQVSSARVCRWWAPRMHPGMHGGRQTSTAQATPQPCACLHDVKGARVAPLLLAVLLQGHKHAPAPVAVLRVLGRPPEVED